MNRLIECMVALIVVGLVAGLIINLGIAFRVCNEEQAAERVELHHIYIVTGDVAEPAESTISKDQLLDMLGDAQ